MQWRDMIIVQMPATPQRRRMTKAVLSISIFGLLFSALPPVSANPALAEAAQNALSKDQQRFVAIVRQLENAPLDFRLFNDRSWAIQWLTDAPDVTVTVCADPLNGVVGSPFAYSAEIVIQYMLGMGAFIVEHPAMKDDPNAQQLAGVESALKAYRAMQAAEPQEKSPALDVLLGKQDRGELAAFVDKAFAQCLANNDS